MKFPRLPAVFTNLLTEKDNITYCPVRVAFIVAVTIYFYGTIHNLPDFISHARDWAAGMRDLLISGMAVAAKAFTEKEPD
jgi:uncharacterized membrane protein YqhA